MRRIPAAVRQRVRELHAAGGMSQRAIGRAVGITHQSVGRIIDDLTKAVNGDTITPVQESRAQVIKRLRRENRRLRERQGTWEDMAAAFADCSALLPQPRRARLRAKASKREQEMVAELSDAHLNEVWTLAQTDGLTEWNFELGCRALWYYGQEIVRLAHEWRSSYGVRRLHVDVLGDIFQAYIRLEDEACNDFPTAPGVATTAHVLYQWLMGLAEHFEAIEVIAVAGNHGRLHQKPQAKRYVGENLDTLVYLIVKQLVAASGMAARIRITVPRTRIHTFQRLGHKIKVGHGDHIRGGNSIADIPIYGLSRDALKAFRREAMAGRHEQIAIIEYGHFHVVNPAFHGHIFLNGALCPTGPWAMDLRGGYEEPTQIVYLTSRKHAFGIVHPLSIKHGFKLAHGFTYPHGEWMEGDTKS